jgi:hypothetical protein
LINIVRIGEIHAQIAAMAHRHLPQVARLGVLLKP